MSAGAADHKAELPSYDEQLTKVLNDLRRLYHQCIRPLEQEYQYDMLKPSWFADTIVQKKPFVTFLGPFSAGKSTFINYLMQSNYLLTGPQPVTDKFTAIFHGDEVQWISGRALIASADQPFRGLTQFGDAFVECFQGLQAPHAILESVSIVDTPGVLEAAEGVHSRRYEYVKVCRWFVERSDLVFFLFDPSKLDSGVELRMLFRHGMRGFENRIRIILNKADTVRPQELMRVYGSLFWNLSTLMDTTEPPRVYVSSFWDKPYKPDTDHKLFTEEKADLLYDLIEVVPLQSLDKRVTHVLRRAQDVLTHSLVCATVRQAMPLLFGKDKAKAAAIAKLPDTFQNIADKHQISAKDFSSQQAYAEFFNKVDLFAMKGIEDANKLRWFETLKRVIDRDLPTLLQPIKTSSVADPRDRKRAIMVSRDYQTKIEEQLQGKQGIQGGLGEMAAMPQRGIQNIGSSTTQQFFSQMPPQQQQQQQQPQYQIQQPPLPQQAPQGQMDPQMMLQMMQMMQMMQQQQQQQQPRQ